MYVTPNRALADAWRIVAVPIPRSDSNIGRVLAMLDANPGKWFAPADLALVLRVDAEICRQSLADLHVRGLVMSQSSDQRLPSGKFLCVYRLAIDYAAQLAPTQREKAAG